MALQSVSVLLPWTACAFVTIAVHSGFQQTAGSSLQFMIGHALQVHVCSAGKHACSRCQSAAASQPSVNMHSARLAGLG